VLPDKPDNLRGVLGRTSASLGAIDGLHLRR
jgi:hypothetical protein